MTHLPDLLALAMLGALVLYLVTGGADFGGGVWDLFSFGPRARAQRELIDRAIAPVWEANHVWLILVVVLLFSAFPSAFSAASTGLHVPITLLLVGIVLRGSAFIFRKYGGGGRVSSRRWGITFASASVVTPIFLGIVMGSITSGTLRVVDGLPTGDYLMAWLAPFPVLVGLFTLAICAFLAAVFLTVEAMPVPALAEDFRRRALAAGIALGVVAGLTRWAAGPDTAGFAERLGDLVFGPALELVTVATAVLALLALFVRRYPAARVFAIAEVTLILVGWGAGQHPYLIAPDVTIRGAAAPHATLRLLGPTLLVGGAVLFPSLWWLLRVFKRRD